MLKCANQATWPIRRKPDQAQLPQRELVVFRGALGFPPLKRQATGRAPSAMTCSLRAMPFVAGAGMVEELWKFIEVKGYISTWERVFGDIALGWSH